ncbi:MAG: peptidase C45 [Phycisphaeraceae bacterium]|nr:MAG: peptidase C45 [Phycisphaeraceae bacterium]
MTGRAIPTAIAFRAINDDPAGAALASVFAEYWPAYRRWMRRASPPPEIGGAAQIRAHMPELFPVYERLLEAFGGGDAIATFLSLYNPPRVVRGCSQIVLDDDGPVLLRSYDHHPALLDDLVLRSAWLGRPTLAMADCLWGALDGINDHGLAIALAFGGRDALGPGFAAPLVTRYILETCATVDDAKDALARVPVYMPYTFVIADASGAFVTAYTGPDVPTRFVTRRASSNHQSTVDWPAYCQHTQSVERLAELESLTAGPASAADALGAFLRPPLWQHNYAHASGTLYVAEYRPAARTMTLHWPGQQEQFTLDAFEPRAFTVGLPTEASER